MWWEESIVISKETKTFKFLILIFSINNPSEKILGCVPLGESGSGFLICGVPFEQIHFQISDLSNPLWTRIRRFTDLRDLKTDNWITDPTRSFRRRIRNYPILPFLNHLKKLFAMNINAVLGRISSGQLDRNIRHKCLSVGVLKLISNPTFLISIVKAPTTRA